jgi:hypothetical protein
MLVAKDRHVPSRRSPAPGEASATGKPNDSRSRSVASAIGNPSGPFAWAVYLTPLGVALAFVLRLGSEAPIVDQWSLVWMFNAAARHWGASFFLHSLLERTNEHPLLFPKLIWMALALTTKWNLRVELIATLLVMLAVFILCASLSFREPSRAGWPVMVSLAVTSLLLFSLVHADTYLSGFQLSFALVNASVTFAIWLLAVWRARPLSRLIAAWLCCVVASFSSLHGMLAWVVILPCLATIFENQRDRVKAVFATGLLAVVTLGGYALAFTGSDPHLDQSFWYKHPIVTAEYFLSVLASPLTARYVAAVPGLSNAAGALAVSIFFSGAYFAVRAAGWRPAAPWISLGLFGLGFSAMATFGRASWGPNGAAALNRYTIVAVFVILAGVHLWRQASSSRVTRLVFLGMAVLVGAATVHASIGSIPGAIELARTRKLAEVCLELIDYIDSRTDNHFESCLYPLIGIKEFVSVVRTAQEELGSIGWRKIAEHVRFIDQPAQTYGYIDQARSAEGADIRAPGWIVSSGWAVIPGEDRLPKAVLFSTGSLRQFIYETQVGTIPRPDVAAFLHRDSATLSGWNVRIPVEFLPPGTTELQAWAFDDKKNEFVRLRGTGLLNPVAH